MKCFYYILGVCKLITICKDYCIYDCFVSSLIIRHIEISYREVLIKSLLSAGKWSSGPFVYTGRIHLVAVLYSIT